MPAEYFPLRWESTGDQWWFASPIDWAAANGHYDVVRELLRVDPNLLIKLTSLSRIRRLEAVWNDEEEEKFNDVAKCRSHVAQRLLQECETNKGYNSLIRAGYGGWLLYSAASAGDVIFVKELLDIEPLLVFGEGEYGVMDIFYATAKSKNSEVFRLLFDCCLSLNGPQQMEISSSVFRWEMMNRAVHAAARGGNMEMLTELLGDGSKVVSYRDGQGSTVLHSASGGGQVEVVRNIISSCDIISSVDNQGNTALHVAAYRGHLSVIEVLLSASPPSAYLTNNCGDTFLHMAVAGFSTPSFRRLNRQMELMKQLVAGKLIDIKDIINVANNSGRTALHVAVIGRIQSDIVELLLSIPRIDLNFRDNEGNAPLDLLKQHQGSASSELLIKLLASAGGISNCQDQTARNALVSHLRMHGMIGGSPGTSFRIPDAELILYTGTGVEDTCASCTDLTSTEIAYSGEIELDRSTSGITNSSGHKRISSENRAAWHFKNLIRWPGKKGSNEDATYWEDSCTMESYRMCSSSKNGPIPLRQQFSSLHPLPSHKRIQSLQGDLPSPSTRKKLAAALTHNAGRVLPKSNLGSPLSAHSESSRSSPISAGPCSSSQSSCLEKRRRLKHSSFKLKSMNDYFCLGGKGLAAESSITSQPQYRNQQNLVV